MIKELGQNRYRFIVSVGSGSNRKKYTKTVTHKGGKKALQKLYDEFENEIRQNPASDMTVQQMIDAYMEHCEVLGRKAETLLGYRKCEKRLQPSLKKTLAKKCTPLQIDGEIASMSRQSLSAKTVKNTIGFLSAAFRYAIKMEQLTDNPCDKATLPKGELKEVRVLHRDEIVPFLNALASAPIDDRVAYMLALFLGLRRSEILGLKESDVDIINGMISVHNTRHRVDGTDYDSSPKTQRSTRVLALPDILIVEIARLLETHRQFPYEKVDYLIQNGCGSVYTPGCLTQRLRRLQIEHNLPLVSLHKLRHTYASLLNESGVDMAQISRQLGHSNLSTTSNIYTHILKTPSQSSRGIAQTINTLELSEKTDTEKGEN